MARVKVLARLRRAPAPPGSRRALPPPGVLRRERRALLRLREEKLRDVGGLLLEMYRRDRFREDLLAERCNDLLALDARVHEIEAMLGAARRRVPAGRCACGAPLPWQSHFCPNCGRPAGTPVVACSACGGPLAADALFCGRCGASTAAPPSGPPDPAAAEQEAGAEVAEA
jgi:hypothetical protein